MMATPAFDRALERADDLLRRLIASDWRMAPLIECRHQGWGRLRHGLSCIGEEMRMNGRVYQSGLGTHADSEILIKTGRPIERFEAWVGVDQNAATALDWDRSVQLIFEVRAGESVLWTSSVLTTSDAPQRVDVDAIGTEELILIVTTANGLVNWGHANWAEAAITLKGGQRQALGSEKPSPWQPYANPISFNFGAVASAKFLPDWEKREVMENRDGQGNTSYLICHRDASTGVECEYEIRTFKDYPVVEYQPRFRNTSDRTSPILDSICSLDLICDVPDAESYLSRSYGARHKADDFLLRRDLLVSGQAMTMEAGGGRSSNNWLPFFNVETGTEGLIVAVGWSGQWAAEFHRDQSSVLRVKAGMQKTHFELRAGEEVRMPSIFLLCWDGDPQAGQNQLRSFLRDHHSPNLAEGRPDPLCCFGWGGMAAVGHIEQINLVEKYELFYDCYWMDAGWYGPDDVVSLTEHDWEWAKHCGDWRVNRSIYPEGIKVVSDRAHAAGMKMLLWIEPERARVGTPITREHPEWFLGSTKPLANVLFNMGDPLACVWLTDFVSHLLKEERVDWLRQDFNIDPLPYWQSNDEVDRQGITEIRYIEGLYRFWDNLRMRHPRLLIDNCASGGRRIDFESLSRSVPLWRSDVQSSPDFAPQAAQNQMHGISHWIPYHGTGTQARSNDTYNFRSAISPALNFYLSPYANNRAGEDYPFAWHQRMIEEFSRIRPLLQGDYYPLSKCTTESDIWVVLQFHHPELNEGVVMAFRRAESSHSVGSYRMRGLVENYDYVVEDLDSAEMRETSGRELLGGGITVTISDPGQSKVYIYREKAV